MDTMDYQTVTDAILAILNGTIVDHFVTEVINRLVSFGYSPEESDAFGIAFAMQKSADHVLNQTNQNTIPDGLKHIYIDMVCGEFLNAKHLTGQLNLSSLDFGDIIQSVHEGDTTVNFASEGSDEAKFNNLVNYLISGKGCDFLCYRRIRW